MRRLLLVGSLLVLQGVAAFRAGRLHERSESQRALAKVQGHWDVCEARLVLRGSPDPGPSNDAAALLGAAALQDLAEQDRWRQFERGMRR